MKIRIAVFAALMSLGGLQAVHALTLYSPTLKPIFPGRTLQCSVLNVSSQPRTAKFSIMKWDGTVLVASANTTVHPGTMRIENTSATTWAYCKVQVTGVKTDWRGAFELQSSTNNGVVTSVSVPLE